MLSDLRFMLLRFAFCVRCFTVGVLWLALCDYRSVDAVFSFGVFAVDVFCGCRFAVVVLRLSLCGCRFAGWRFAVGVFAVGVFFLLVFNGLLFTFCSL